MSDPRLTLHAVTRADSDVTHLPDDYTGSAAAEVKAKIEANIPADLAAAAAALTTPAAAGENYLAHWVFKVSGGWS